jgi:hypothetical protein
MLSTNAKVIKVTKEKRKQKRKRKEEGKNQKTGLGRQRSPTQDTAYSPSPFPPRTGTHFFFPLLIVGPTYRVSLTSSCNHQRR